MPAKKPTTTDFPATFIEAVKFFADLDNCEAYLTSRRWPEGPVCQRCDGKDIAPIKSRRLLRCRSCQKQFSVKLGTIFEASPIGLDKWLPAVWLLTNCKNGISSYELARDLGVTQKTAWFMLHRIRLAMQDGNQEPLSGKVEVDETFIGGKAKNMHKDKKAAKITGTGTVGKAVVVGLLARNTAEKPSQVQAKVVSDTRKATLQPEVRAHVATGAELFTDCLSSYEGLDSEYVHQTIDHAVKYAEGVVHINGMENFWSLLDRTLGGTYVSVDPDHLTSYVDEQAFRFNERKDANGDSGRFQTVTDGITGKRVMYKELIARPEGAGPRRGG